MLLFDVQNLFDMACKTMLDKNPELKVPWRFIKDHERYPLTLRKLCQQVLYFEQGARTGRKTAYNRYQLIAAHAQLFIKLAIQHKDESVKSKADLHKEQIESRPLRDAQEQGLIQEMNHKTGRLQKIK